MVSSSPIKLKVPRQDLRDFTLFALNKEGASDWAHSLPITNTGAVVQQLRQAVADLNRLPMSPEIRYQILETLRPNADVALSNLSRRFLNQPLVMPEQPRQMAELAENFYGLLATAYTIAAIEAIQHPDRVREVNPARLVCESIQRALIYAGQKILHAFELYRAVEVNGWRTVHQLFALAEGQQLTELAVADPGAGASTIASTYAQIMLLGCCKPNQLRQSDLVAIYKGLSQWSHLVKISSPPDGGGLFLVDLHDDQPPIYSSLYGDEQEPHCRLIDTDPLISKLEALKITAPVQGVTLDKNTVLPTNILEHMITSLGHMSLRNFKRDVAGSTVWISIGLSSAHYHLGSGKTFEQLLFGSDYIPPASDRVATNPFLLRAETSDPWQKANPEEDFVREDDVFKSAEEIDADHRIEVDPQTLARLEWDDDTDLPMRERFAVHEVKLANASPGGYCLEWNTQLPASIHTGDIVCLREQKNQRWAIAVIRWISHPEHGEPLMGLELISPRATPYGACIQKKTGGKTNAMRVLLLPEISLVGQPHTLITPRAGFREQQKITLVREGEEFHIQLLRQVAATGSFAQFDFRYIKQLGEVLAEEQRKVPPSAYDSVWDEI
tara:strand:- start:335870 stop:337705 length:1836 start_codon:yes stop_codon:yes gene_type:complete